MLMLRFIYMFLILFLFTFRPGYGNSNIRRNIVDENVKGSSFGLDSFYVQPFQPDNKETGRRVRPTTNHNSTLNEKGQVYGLENFSVGAYDSNNFQPLLTSAEFHSRRISAATRQTPKLPLINETNSKITGDLETFSRFSPPPENVTEKTKKRIMLRKRRKRPSNSTQIENDIIENREANLNRIQSVPKSVVRNKISYEDGLQTRRTFETSLQTDNKKEFNFATPQGTTKMMDKSFTTFSKTYTTRTTQRPSINLKNFLKQQTETLSLSELLQTRNLSLADLLEGNGDPSEILKTQHSPPVFNSNIRRKVSHRVVSTTERFEHFDKISEPKKQEKVIETTPLQPNHNRHNQKIAKTEIEGQYSNILENKQKIKNDVEEISTTKKTSFDHRSRANELKIKLRNFQRRTQTPATLSMETTSSMPPKETITSLLPLTSSFVNNSTEPTSKNTSNLESFSTSSETVTEWKNNRPERVSNFLKRLPSLKKFVKEKIRPTENLTKKAVNNVSSFKSENKTKEVLEKKISELKNRTTPYPLNELNTTFEEPQTPEKVTEKDDLLEFLNSEQNASKLQEILHSRNMTLQEVLENRERPTVQSNISELFANHQKEVSYSTQSSKTFNGDGLPDFMDIIKKISTELPPTTTDFEEPYAEESVTSIVKIQSPTFREAKQFGDVLFNDKEELRLNLKPNDLTKEKSKMEISAVWNLSESPSLEEPSFTFRDIMESDDITEPENPNELPDNVVKLFVNNYKKLNNRKFKQGTRDQNFSEEPVTEDVGKAYIPPAVKSAIVASGIVMGIALFVFIAIFAACGWKQRQIRLKNSSSILNEALNKQEKNSKCTNTLSPDNFKRKKLKKTIDFEDDDDDSSESGSSTTGSYLWNTLKNTFKSRSNTLKNRLEREEKMKGHKMTLGRFDSRRVIENRHENRSNTFQIQKDRFQTKKIDRDRNVISTSFNFRRSLSPNDINDFNECPHGF